MFYLIGLGLCSEKDLTLKAVDSLKKCGEIYLESYTGLAPGLKIKKLEELIGKKVVKLNREKVENEKLVLRAKRKKIALIVVGDPLTATTHAELLLECKKQGIRFEVVHNASVLTAVGETGLQLYKFGKTVSVPFHEADSYLKLIQENRKLGMHTLCLLDLDVKNNKFMSIKEAFQKLMLKGDDEIVVVSKLGCRDQKIIFGKTKSLIKLSFMPPCSVIIPGKLHFKEEEYLRDLHA